MAGVGRQNLARLVEESHAARGDYPALLYEHRWHSSEELFERSRRLAAGLSELGVGPGDRVVVTMANCPEVAIAYQALWRAGAVVTPAMFLLAAPDLRHLIADAQACAVITTPEFLDKVQEAVAGLGCVRHVICAGAAGEPGGAGALGEPGGAGAPGEPAGLLSLAAVEDQAPPGPIVARADDDLAALLYTGGTTGRAKGVMLSHASLYYTGRAAHEAAYVPGISRGLGVLPLSHAYGLLVTLAGLHHPERPVSVLLRWFDPQAFLTLIPEHQIQLSAVVPTMLQILLGLPLEEHDLSSLRYLSSGGAPLAAETEQEFCRRVPSVRIRQGYGLTETAALVSANPTGRERAGSVGMPIPGTEIEIRDLDGAPLPAGDTGEICVRSPGIMQGYWHAPDATAEALRDGWLHTGDVGYRDADGYLYVIDRVKDLIIRGGFNVYPRDVEDALAEHPAVGMAAVIGRPDERQGEEVVAFVSPAPGAAIGGDELVGWARERIGGYKYPREVHVVDAIPLTAVGKIDRKALRERLAVAAAPAG